jgi:hypothetical protein
MRGNSIRGERGRGGGGGASTIGESIARDIRLSSRASGTLPASPGMDGLGLY